MKSCLKLTVIILTLMLVLSACKKSETEFVLNEFSSTVTFCLEEEEYKGDFVFRNKDEMTIVLSQPESIKGSTFTYKNGETTLSFDGVIIAVRKTSPIKILFEALSDFSKAPHTVKRKGTEVISSLNENGKYDVSVNCDEMRIKEINTGETVYILS